jgi:hypothetical protein
MRLWSVVGVAVLASQAAAQQGLESLSPLDKIVAIVGEQPLKASDKSVTEVRGIESAVCRPSMF